EDEFYLSVPSRSKAPPTLLVAEPPDVHTEATAVGTRTGGREQYYECSSHQLPVLERSKKSRFHLQQGQGHDHQFGLGSAETDGAIAWTTSGGSRESGASASSGGSLSALSRFLPAYFVNNPFGATFGSTSGAS
ncbi:unnamed protein product, partial [Amoebophrya sp. A25]